MEEYKALVEYIAKNHPDIISKAYEDLAQPAVKKVGKALEIVLDFANTLLFPIQLINAKRDEYFKHNMNKYKEELSNIPDEKINQVPPQLGLPILDRFTYVTDDELSDLFINLLTKASSIDTIHEAHPSFIQLIDRLSVDEARILEYLKIMTEIPYINVSAPSKIKGSIYLIKHFTGIEKYVKLDYMNNINMYLENLISIGILNDEFDRYFTEDFRYDMALQNLVNCDLSNKLIFYNNFEDYFEVNKSFFTITDFGRKFINSITKKIEDKNTFKGYSYQEGKLFKKNDRVIFDKLGKGNIVAINTDDLIIVKFDYKTILFYKNGAEKLTLDNAD